ncbi:LppU/SCO3897 family protein [Amycolatopsis sp. NPDC004772]
MTTPPFDDNPFRSPGYAQSAPMPPVPGQQAIPHWFTTKVRITLVACVVVALGLGALGAMAIYWADRSGPPSDGDCLYLTREGAGKLAYHRVGCSANNATYKVENTYRSGIACGSGDYVRFRLGSGSASGRTLCLALNVKAGDCLRDVDDESTIGKVLCTDPAAQERVEILSGYGRDDKCEGADLVFSYSGPPARTVCLIKTGENI